MGSLYYWGFCMGLGLKVSVLCGFWVLESLW
jgi:hypothetical protein